MAADTVFGWLPAAYLPAFIGTVVLWLTAGRPLLRRAWQHLSVVSTHHRVVVQGSVSEVFDFLADFSNAEKWDPNTKTAVRDQPGPLRPGCTFSLVTLWKGSESPMKYTLGIHDRKEGRIVLKGDAPLVTALDARAAELKPAKYGNAEPTDCVCFAPPRFGRRPSASRLRTAVRRRWWTTNLRYSSRTCCCVPLRF